MRQIRQGDILLKEINLEEYKNKTLVGQGRRAIAYGEVTGHSHVLNGNVKYYESGGMTLCQVEDGVLTHEEHKNIEIPKGDYIIINQREFDIMSGIRKVMD